MLVSGDGMDWIGWDSSTPYVPPAIVDSNIIIELTTVYSVVRVVCGLLSSAGEGGSCALVEMLWMSMVYFRLLYYQLSCWPRTVAVSAGPLL